MRVGVEILCKEGFDIDGFVYFCNKYNYLELLKSNNIKVVRGEDDFWYVKNDIVTIFLGFWIFLAFYLVKDVKKIEDKGITSLYDKILEFDIFINKPLSNKPTSPKVKYPPIHKESIFE